MVNVRNVQKLRRNKVYLQTLLGALKNDEYFDSKPMWFTIHSYSRSETFTRRELMNRITATRTNIRKMLGKA